MARPHRSGLTRKSRRCWPTRHDAHTPQGERKNHRCLFHQRLRKGPPRAHFPALECRQSDGTLAEEDEAISLIERSRETAAVFNSSRTQRCRARTAFQAACQIGLEGIVSKRLTAPYKIWPYVDYFCNCPLRGRLFLEMFRKRLPSPCELPIAFMRGERALWKASVGCPSSPCWC